MIARFALLLTIAATHAGAQTAFDECQQAGRSDCEQYFVGHTESLMNDTLRAVMASSLGDLAKASIRDEQDRFMAFVRISCRAFAFRDYDQRFAKLYADRCLSDAFKFRESMLTGYLSRSSN